MTNYINKDKPSQLSPKTANQLHISNLTESQKIISKCNALIRTVTNSPKQYQPGEGVCKDNVLSNDVVEEFNLPFDEESVKEKAIQPTREYKSLQRNTNDNLLESMFCHNSKNTERPQLYELPLSDMESFAQKFDQELETIPRNLVKNNERIAEIKVLQNIILRDKNERVSGLQYSLEDEWQKMEEKSNDSSNSKEVFSDSDVEVIDTTPQKIKSAKNV